MRQRVPLLRVGIVRKVMARRGGAAELLVEMEGREKQAINYEQLTGEVLPGERVLLNVSAVALDLGTGGKHLVVANLSRPERDIEAEGKGMKLRYSPLQRPVRLVEEEFPQAFSAPAGLDGMPVILAPLHSLAMACIVGLRWLKEDVRVAFVMDDWAGLVAGFSEVLCRVEERRMATTITVGQALGGQIEAVNVYSGLLAARKVVGAEVAVVGPGPGHLGTGTKYGFSSLSLLEAANAAAALEGNPLLIPRVSFAERRERHRGLSHHILTLLCLCPTPVVVPFPLLPAEEEKVVSTGWQQVADRHKQVFRDGGFIGEALEGFGGLESMGRGYADGPAFFEAAGAAARLAVETVEGGRPLGKRRATQGTRRRKRPKFEPSEPRSC